MKTQPTRKVLRFSRSLNLLTLVSAGFTGCHSAAPSPGGPLLHLNSPDFASGTIPARFSSCPGQSNLSPALTWDTPPSDAKSLALIVYDRDSPLGTNFVHWLLYNLPPTRTSLAQGIPKQGELPDGTRQGRNGFGDLGYGGPCPPGHAAHHYVFNLYALNSTLDLPPAGSEPQLADALKDHVIAGGQLTATFGR